MLEQTIEPPSGHEAAETHIASDGSVIIAWILRKDEVREDGATPAPVECYGPFKLGTTAVKIDLPEQLRNRTIKLDCAIMAPDDWPPLTDCLLVRGAGSVKQLHAESSKSGSLRVYVGPGADGKWPGEIQNSEFATVFLSPSDHGGQLILGEDGPARKGEKRTVSPPAGWIVSLAVEAVEPAP